MTRFPFRDGLAYKQAQYTVVIAFILGLILSAIQIYLDYFTVQDELKTTTDQFLKIMGKPIAQALASKDKELSEDLVVGLFQYQPVYKVTVYDANQVSFVSIEQRLQQSQWRWISDQVFGKNKIFQVPLAVMPAKIAMLNPVLSLEIGVLQVTVDTYFHGASFIKRAGTILVAGVFRNFFLALIFLIFFHYYLTKPFLALESELDRIDPKSSNPPNLLPPKGHHNDEFGSLMQKTNTLLQTIGEAMTERQQKAAVIEEQNRILANVMKATQAISSEIRLEQLLGQLIQILIQHMEAEKGILILKKEDQLFVEIEGYADSKTWNRLQPQPLEDYPSLAITLIHHVAKTQETLILNEITQEEHFFQDPYIRQNTPQAILCKPLIQQGRLTGILYLENQSKAKPFNINRLEALDILAAQAAISIENAQLYQQQQQHVEQLKEYDRLKDEFLANTSHELRTPLMGIIGLGESLLQANSLEDKHQVRLKMIVQSGQRLSHLINDLLDISRIKKGRFALNIQAVNVREIVDLVFTITQPLIGSKQIQLVNTISAQLPAVAADENRLQQIFFNLIDNAIKYTPVGAVAVSANVHENHMQIEVVDTGIGIPPDQQDRVFNMFETFSAKEYGGTGLGLALTKQLIELHQGTITLDSERAEGTRFLFTLPLHQQKASASTPSPAIISSFQQPIEIPFETSAPTQAEQAYLLVVEDDPVILQVLHDQLSQQNYKISTAMNGYEALETLEAESDIDLVLLDVMMPEMNGFEVCRLIRQTQNTYQLPILILSARTQVDDVVTGLRYGANDYLIKPIHQDELLMRVSNHLEIKKSVHRLKENKKLKKEIEHRIHIEKELRVFQKRLVRILDTSEEGLLSFNHHRRITFFNQKAEQILGYGSQEVLGRSIQWLFPQLSTVNSIEPETKAWHLETRPKGQQTNWIEATVAPFKLEEETGFILNIAPMPDPQVTIGQDASTMDSPNTRLLQQRLKNLEGAISSLTGVLNNDSLFQETRQLPQHLDTLDLVSKSASSSPNLRQITVETMNLALRYWQQTTGKTKLDLAEDSQIWKTYLDKQSGTYRSRTLDKYLHMDSLPQRPRWQNVLATAYYVLQHAKEDAPKLKTELENNVTVLETTLQLA